MKEIFEIINTERLYTITKHFEENLEKNVKGSGSHEYRVLKGLVEQYKIIIENLLDKQKEDVGQIPKDN